MRPEEKKFFSRLSEYFRSTGFKISMAEIADSAQFVMGTVCRFFKSKEGIYISLVDEKVEELLPLFKRRHQQRIDHF